MTTSPAAACEGCGNTRRKVYQHESGRRLCNGCLARLKHGFLGASEVPKIFRAPPDPPLLLKRLRAAERICELIKNEGLDPARIGVVRDFIVEWQEARREHHRGGGIRK